jgi:hypothetical protein
VYSSLLLKGTVKNVKYKEKNTAYLDTCCSNVGILVCKHIRKTDFGNCLVVMSGYELATGSDLQATKVTYN